MHKRKPMVKILNNLLHFFGTLHSRFVQSIQMWLALVVDLAALDL